MLSLLGMVLGGGYLPLQLWPDFMQGFLFIQPFAGITDIPARLYVGSMPVNEAAAAIGLQLFWTAIFITAGKLLMNRKLKSLIVQGG
jgi:ABC-2 type transport system permease protein